MPTAQEWLALVERITRVEGKLEALDARSEADMKELKRQLAARDSLVWRIITTIIAAAGAYGAVLSAEILRHNGG